MSVGVGDMKLYFILMHDIYAVIAGLRQLTEASQM